MDVMVVGASRGLGRAFVDGLGGPGWRLWGVARSVPAPYVNAQGAEVRFISADLASPREAADRVEAACPERLDVLVQNVGIWEPSAFEHGYRFADEDDAVLAELVAVNITATILLVRRLLPRLLASSAPRVVLVGSTSGLPQSGRPEVGFGASKFALRGVADALRENHRADRLGVTLLQLGYLDTEHGLDVDWRTVGAGDGGEKVPLHDVVALVRACLALSPASYVRELVLPAIADPRF